MRFRKYALALALPAMAFSSAAMAAVTYQQTSTTGLTSNSTVRPDTVDDINLAPGSTATSPQRLSAVTFGAVVAPGTAAQSAVVFFDFYNNIDPASTGPTVATNYLGGFGGTLTLTANTGTSGAARSFSFSGLETLTTPIDFTDDSLAVEVTFANAAGTQFSTILSSLTSLPGVPTVGSSVTGVYRDANADGNFAATELDPTAGNLYLQLTTINAPEPASASILAVAGLASLRRRRRA